jgi:hypothetical protein
MNLFCKLKKLTKQLVLLLKITMKMKITEIGNSYEKEGKKLIREGISQDSELQLSNFEHHSSYTTSRARSFSLPDPISQH